MPNDAQRSSGELEHRFLHWCWRTVVALMGVFLILYSLVLTYQPPTRLAVDADSKGQVIKSTTFIADQSSLAIAVFIAGVVLFSFAANGLRIERIIAGKIELHTSKAVDKAEEYYARTDRDPPKEIPSNDPVPEPRAIGQEVRGDGAAYETFELKDVPTKVLEDLKTNWPQDVNVIESFDSFEFAQRRRGQGNNAWLVKFRDRPMIKVAYGGQGKSTSTVGSQDK